MEKWNTHNKTKDDLIPKIIEDIELAYRPVHHHGYIKNTSKGMYFEVLVDIADSDT